jgi:SagB-type dehydrogenase family enzyme
LPDIINLHYVFCNIYTIFVFEISHAMKKIAMFLMIHCVIMILCLPIRAQNNASKPEGKQKINTGQAIDQTTSFSVNGEQKVIPLPAPQTDGGMPLMKALKNRQTNREFGEGKISQQVLSNLLWAACGINRPEAKKRTAPSAMNYQEVDVYVITAEGVCIYDAEKHALIEISKEDIRSSTGTQPFVATAPLDLVLVADYSKMARSDEKNREILGMADAAYISENIYLFCASGGLNTGVRASIDKEACAKALQLKENQHIMLGHSVGYPKEK